MLIQEKISSPETLLKLYIAIDEDLKALRPQLQARQFPRDPRGGAPLLSAAEALTILVWGAWRGLTDKAKVYFHAQMYHRRELPTLVLHLKRIEGYSLSELSCNANRGGRKSPCQPRNIRWS
jgi:hypothetical protein